MCTGPKWKREVVPDHKFDFVDTREFTDNGFTMRAKYLWLYIMVLKSFLVYVSDIFTAITMLTTHSWSNQILDDCNDQRIQGCIAIPFDTGKWLFVGCIIFSFCLLGYESRKAKKIIASRDISYAFTNVLANNYYSLRSYDHFCFFDHISNSTKTSDDFAFFVFFVFKSWKRVLLADGPRQTINALTLYAIFLVNQNRGPFWDISKYFDRNNIATSVLTVTTFFTVAVFAGSLLLLVVAGICYIPLLCYIRGNLKEYCCHKVDKRISSVIKRRQKQRLADAAKLAQKEAQGDYSHLKNKKGEFIAQPLPQPTLPNVSLDDDDDMTLGHSGAASSTYTYSQDYYYQSEKDYVPPMPGYNPYSQHQVPGAPQFNASQTNFYEESIHNYPINYSQSSSYGIERPGTANISDGNYRAASPYNIERPGTANLPDPRTQRYNGETYDPHDIYQGRIATTSPDGLQRRSPIPHSPNSGLAYDLPTPSYTGQQQGYDTLLTSPHSAYSGYSSNPSLHAQGRGSGA